MGARCAHGSAARSWPSAPASAAAAAAAGGGGSSSNRLCCQACAAAVAGSPPPATPQAHLAAAGPRHDPHRPQGSCHRCQLLLAQLLQVGQGLGHRRGGPLLGRPTGGSGGAGGGRRRRPLPMPVCCCCCAAALCAVPCCCRDSVPRQSSAFSRCGLAGERLASGAAHRAPTVLHNKAEPHAGSRFSAHRLHHGCGFSGGMSGVKGRRCRPSSA